MAATSTRTLTLLSLLQAGRTWSGADLAARLEVSTRTVRRDVETLRGLGYPVSASRGPSGTYRWGAGGTLPPLVLDEEQAVAVALALQTAPVPVAGLGDAAPRALATLRQVMSPGLRARVDAVRVTAVPHAWDFAAPPLDPDVLAAVGAAVSRGHVLRVDAVAADGARPVPGEVGFRPPRRLEPHDLVVWAGRWYLVAFDLDAGDWAVLRVDRLHPLAATGTPFARREVPGGSAEAFVTTRPDRGDTPAGWPCLGSVVLHLPAPVVARWAPGGSVVEDAGPGRCRFTLGAWSWAGVAGILATFDAPVSEVEPAGLREALRTLSARFAAIS
ncbi:helix-turn-helix transcriptional regulator [Kineococcus siccus]|uniref:helix-turn-helix transcriptional regulator n=1 Tax=Kineococcus siccus TaxID=2696567 RepID=UPI001F0D3016|nr:WYL domain-containing protein [Kineococcus siccus]